MKLPMLDHIVFMETISTISSFLTELGPGVNSKTGLLSLIDKETGQCLESLTFYVLHIK